MPVITISTYIASGAREIAQSVARELQLDYLDQEILVEAARDLGVPVAAVQSHDERASSFGERIASVLRKVMERSAAAGMTDPMSGGGLEVVLGRSYGEQLELSRTESGQLDDERYFKTLTSVIKGIAARGNVVLLGRGSQAILQQHEDALHIFIATPRPMRAQTLAARESISLQDAEHRLKHSDQESQAFHRRYFKVELENPALYDLVIQAGRVSDGLAVKLIALLARERSPRPG